MRIDKRIPKLRLTSVIAVICAAGATLLPAAEKAALAEAPTLPTKTPPLVAANADAPPATGKPGAAGPQISPTVDLFDDNSGGGAQPALFSVTDPATGAELPALDKLPLPTPEPVIAQTGSPSQNVTINLINRLVQRGVLTHADAEELIKQAIGDAAKARAEQEATDALAPAGDGAVRVAYIPESVKAQIRDEIKTEVLAQAKDEKWGGAAAFPDWVNRIRWFGDIRVRYEVNTFPVGNDNTGSFPNFNAINTGKPFDVAGTVFSPQLNVDEERMRIRLRARIGMDVNLGDGFWGGIRLVTGDTNTPVSANQSFGLANQGQGGNFSKYAIWLDRAFIKYELARTPKPLETAEAPLVPFDPKNPLQSPPPPPPASVNSPWDYQRSLAIMAGRFDNPFFTASEVIWDEDIGFDGVALMAKYEVFRGVTPFIAGGLFPIFNTDFNFSSNQPDKFESTDKWLYGAQGGIAFEVKHVVAAKFAAAYYDFRSVEGQLSDPYTPFSADDAGNTDNTRPSFAQKGNTYMALRDIVPSVLNNYGTTNQFQYFGLATPFTVGSLTARIDINAFEPYQISLLGDYSKNLQFDRAAIDAIAVNNRGAIAAGDLEGIGDYAGGDTAWSAQIQVGKGKFEKRWDWSASFGYRYVESDAVVDAFADSDFVVAGTNHKGITLGAALAVSPRVKIGVRWMSANEIAGPPLSADILMFDLSAKF